MQITKLIILFTFMTCVNASFVFAQNSMSSTDLKSVTDFVFRFDKTVIERDYLSNSRSLDRLDSLFASCSSSVRIDSIVVSACASPEGCYNYNVTLARNRAESIKRFLLWRYPCLDASKIITCSTGENWNDLIGFIRNDPDLHHKDRIIRIIPDKAHLSEREALLRLLNQGAIWRIIEKKYLKFLRKGATCVIYYNKTATAASEMRSINKQLHISNKISSKKHISCPRKLLPPDLEKATTYKPLFSLKSNLLADVATFINVALEVPFGKRWSASAQWMFPWWIFDNHKYYNQILLGTLEGKYWFHTRKQQEVLSGHALGIYASGGYYDFQWKKTGYQGEIIPSAGISYTYAHKIGKLLRMEYSVGVGFLNTKYRKYTANNHYDQFPWLSSGRTLWFGPTKAEISFVWLISKRVRNEK